MLRFLLKIFHILDYFVISGFIPFGVRKQASQFPKKNISRKQSLQTVKNNFNKQKPSRFQALAAKKTSASIDSRQKVIHIFFFYVLVLIFSKSGYFFSDIG